MLFFFVVTYIAVSFHNRKKEPDLRPSAVAEAETLGTAEEIRQPQSASPHPGLNESFEESQLSQQLLTAADPTAPPNIGAMKGSLEIKDGSPVFKPKITGPPSVEAAKVAVLQEADVGSAVNMIANTVVVASAFYLVNSDNMQLRTLTWGMLDTAISIVCAILMFEIVKDTLYLIALPEEHGFETPNAIASVLAVILAQFMLYLLFHSPGTTVVRAVNNDLLSYPLKSVRFKAFGPTVARFYAFSWITFWSFYQVDKDNSASIIVDWVPVMAFFAGWLILAGVRFVRLKIIDSHVASTGATEPDKDDKDWEANACRAEFAGFGLCLSFLVTQVVRYHVSTVMPTPKGGDTMKAATR
jgi:hypothetical protein